MTVDRGREVIEVLRKKKVDKIFGDFPDTFLDGTVHLYPPHPQHTHLHSAT